MIKRGEWERVRERIEGGTPRVSGEGGREREQLHMIKR